MAVSSRHALGASYGHCVAPRDARSSVARSSDRSPSRLLWWRGGLCCALCSGLVESVGRGLIRVYSGHHSPYLLEHWPVLCRHVPMEGTLHKG